MQNMLIVARLMIAAAGLRSESRGVHYRRDFPETDPAMNEHISLQAIAPIRESSREHDRTEPRLGEGPAIIRDPIEVRGGMPFDPSSESRLVVPFNCTGGSSQRSLGMMRGE